MSVVRTALLVSGLLLAVFLLLALLVRRDERPLLRKLRAIVVDGAYFWLLAVPAWFGGVAGLVLSAERPAPLGMRIVSITILVLGFLVAVLPIGIWSSSRLWSRTMSRDKMLRLIRAGRIELFIRHGGTVRVHYADGPTGWRPAKADVDGYPAYVAATKEQGDQGPSYRDFSAEDPPSEHSRRWITRHEAEIMLANGKISTFHYGQPDDFPFETIWNDPTGIKLISYGPVHHLYVDPALEESMIPIAREARNDHGIPDFFVDGHRQGD